MGVDTLKRGGKLFAANATKYFQKPKAVEFLEIWDQLQITHNQPWTPEQRNSLYSKPEPMKCGIFDNGVFQGNNFCHLQINNHQQPNATVVIWEIKLEDHFFTLFLSYKDPSLETIYSEIPNLIFRSITRVGEPASPSNRNTAESRGPDNLRAR